jgi:hypothetical protein
MSSQNEAHGDEDVLIQPTARDYDLALDLVIETIMTHGMWPEPKRPGVTKSEFNLYDFLAERQDSSYWLEMYLGVLTGSNIYGRTKREIATVEEMLEKHLRGSEIVETVALDLSRGE